MSYLHDEKLEEQEKYDEIRDEFPDLEDFFEYLMNDEVENERRNN